MIYVHSPLAYVSADVQIILSSPTIWSIKFEHQPCFLTSTIHDDVLSLSYIGEKLYLLLKSCPVDGQLVWLAIIRFGACLTNSLDLPSKVEVASSKISAKDF